MTAIGNIISSPVKQVGKGMDKTAEENAQIADLFSGIMQQSQEGFPQYDGVDSKDEVLNLTGTQSKTSDNSIERDVAKLNSSKRIESKPEDTDKTSARQKITDKMDNVKETTKSVKEVIKNAYGISDEDLEKAMADLGITEFDLLDTKNLVALVKEITGADDVSALLSDPVFKDVFSQVNDIIADFMKTEGIDSNGLNEIVAMMDEVSKEETVEFDSEVLDTPVEINGDVVNASEGEVMVNNNNQEMTLNAETSVNQLSNTAFVEKMPEETNSKDNIAVQAGNEENITAEVKEDINPLNANIEDKADEYSDDSEDDSIRRTVRVDAQTAKNVSAENETTDDIFAKSVKTDDKLEFNTGINHFNENTPVNAEPTQVTPEMPQPAYTYDDIQNLMDQVNGMFRTFSTAEETTIQMQLNPENLGRLFMSISEKDGAVTAQITTTSEESKDMLLTQLVELRSNLQMQGIKVEAVEVSVATHEFEQNLESGDSTGREMSEQQQRDNLNAQTRGRRNISLDNLDELQGVMSEEEAIVASMMRTNGQTVDYTA